jgi:adenylate cyclase
MSRLLVVLRRTITLLIDRIGSRLRNNFYIYVAVILSVVAVVDLFTVNFIVGMRNKSFDMMVKYRVRVAPPDSTIVIVDIDEKSLAAMAPEFGRWPWPRQVFGEFVQKAELQKPSAIVFDVLFSDPDVYNTESDAYFDEAIGKTGNTWFPMVRLDKSADRASSLAPAKVPGARVITPIDSTATIAVILPFLASVQKSGRTGFNNIIPDIDGVCREYPVRYSEHGCEIASLPFAVARAQNPSISVPDKILLNWRGKPFTYKHISFSDVYFDMRKEHPQRDGSEFAGKVIIVGSTAPSLFDNKVTAVDRQFPGVEILATAIDNLRKGDWLRVPEMPIVYLLITLAILWMTAFGFYRRGAGGKLDQFYGLSQFILLAISYTEINLFNVYINLTGPVMFGFIYYSVARYYAFATARALDDSVVRVKSGDDSAFGHLLALRFDLPTREEKLIAKFAAVLTGQCAQKPSAEWLTGRQKGFWRLFENTLFLCWRADKTDDTKIKAIQDEVEKIVASLPRLLGDKPMDGALPIDRCQISRAEGGIGSGEQEEWRILMGAALLHQKGEKRS